MLPTGTDVASSSDLVKDMYSRAHSLLYHKQYNIPIIQDFLGISYKFTFISIQRTYLIHWADLILAHKHQESCKKKKKKKMG